jgi:hypothetical protein
MHHECRECQKFWRDYAVATSAYFRLDDEIRSIALEIDLDRFAMLTNEIEMAQSARMQLREAILEHEYRAHKHDEPQSDSFLLVGRASDSAVANP